MKAVHLAIQGIVQGVSYRANAQHKAQRLGLTGWVRNRRDSSVEAFAQGPDAEVDQFVEWCRRGPANARVDRLDVTPGTVDGNLRSFDVRPTA